MKIERLLQYLIAVLAALGTVLLGMGSGNLILPLLAIFAAATSLYVTDHYGWIYLNRTLANLAAIAAMLISIHDFLGLGRDRQLLAIAYLIVYLQIVLLYQRKETRVYWQLLTLSLLQVVVAAALNFSLAFGLLMAAYLFLALLAMFVFYVFREQTRQRALGGDRSQVRLASGLLRSEAGSPAERRFQAGLAWRAVRQGASTLLLTFVAFLLLPRMGDGEGAVKAVGQRMVGFTDTVRLGDLGTTLENQQPVMRLWLNEPAEAAPFRLVGEPLLRGAIVDRYQSGTWSLAGTRRRRNENIELPEARPDMTRQRIAMAPLREATLFTIYPPYTVRRSSPVAFNMQQQQLVRTTPARGRLEVVLATSGIRYRRQSPLQPVGPFDYVRGAGLLQPFGPPHTDNAQLERFAALTGLADQIVSDAELPAGDTIAKARALERFLKDAERFEYTLTGESRDPELDPLVDFLTKNRRGHCEYFSSALTLMLRSQGIKARMVIGFKGGEWNPLGGYYQVRQKHAHSWTEAYIPPQELSGMPSGSWLILDPTPVSTLAAADMQTASVLRYYRQLRNYGEFLWSKYVIELDARRQREGIYAPFIAAGQLLGKLTEWEFWKQLPSEMLPAAHGVNRGGPLRGWPLPILVLLIFCSLLWLCRRIFISGSGSQRQAATAATAPPVPFYRKLESVLGRYGHQRRAAQTPREYAARVGELFWETSQLRVIASVPQRVVTAYYDVCYGGRRLAATEQQKIEGLLAQLETSLAADAAKRPAGPAARR